MKRIRTMIIDDSATVRQVLTQVLGSAPDIEVIATAADPLFAIRKMNKDWPDVIVLDLEMPRMDGLTFLRKLMAEHPTPVVICSSLAEHNAEVTLQALAVGAVLALAAFGLVLTTNALTIAWAFPALAVTLFYPVAIWVYWGAHRDGALSLRDGILSAAFGAALMASPIVLLKIKSRRMFQYSSSQNVQSER